MKSRVTEWYLEYCMEVRAKKEPGGEKNSKRSLGRQRTNGDEIAKEPWGGREPDGKMKLWEKEEQVE